MQKITEIFTDEEIIPIVEDYPKHEYYTVKPDDFSISKLSYEDKDDCRFKRVSCSYSTKFNIIDMETKRILFPGDWLYTSYAYNNKELMTVRNKNKGLNIFNKETGKLLSDRWFDEIKSLRGKEYFYVKKDDRYIVYDNTGKTIWDSLHFEPTVKEIIDAPYKLDEYLMLVYTDEGLLYAVHKNKEIEDDVFDEIKVYCPIPTKSFKPGIFDFYVAVHKKGTPDGQYIKLTKEISSRDISLCYALYDATNNIGNLVDTDLFIREEFPDKFRIKLEDRPSYYKSDIINCISDKKQDLNDEVTNILYIENCHYGFDEVACFYYGPNMDSALEIGYDTRTAKVTTSLIPDFYINNAYYMYRFKNDAVSEPKKEISLDEWSIEDIINKVIKTGRRFQYTIVDGSFNDILEEIPIFNYDNVPLEDGDYETVIDGGIAYISERVSIRLENSYRGFNIKATLLIKNKKVVDIIFPKQNVNIAEEIIKNHKDNIAQEIDRRIMKRVRTMSVLKNYQ